MKKKGPERETEGNRKEGDGRIDKRRKLSIMEW